jgi:hypothetical protein
MVGLSTPQAKMPTLHMNLSKLAKIESGPKMVEPASIGILDVLTLRS